MSKFLNLLAALVLVAPALAAAQGVAAVPVGFDMYASRKLSLCFSTYYELPLFSLRIAQTSVPLAQDVLQAPLLLKSLVRPGRLSV